jgi:hypothetical protein
MLGPGGFLLGLLEGFIHEPDKHVTKKPFFFVKDNVSPPRREWLIEGRFP